MYRKRPKSNKDLGLFHVKMFIYYNIILVKYLPFAPSICIESPTAVSDNDKVEAPVIDKTPDVYYKHLYYLDILQTHVVRIQVYISIYYSSR